MNLLCPTHNLTARGVNPPVLPPGDATIQKPGCRVQGPGSRVLGAGSRVKGLESRVKGDAPSLSCRLTMKATTPVSE